MFVLIFLRLWGPETPLSRGTTTAKVVVAGGSAGKFLHTVCLPCIEPSHTA